VLADHVALARKPPCCIGRTMEITCGLLPLPHGIAPRHTLLEESGTWIAAASFGPQLGLVANGTGCGCHAHRQRDQNGYQCKTEDRGRSWHLTFLSCGDTIRAATLTLPVGWGQLRLVKPSTFVHHAQLLPIPPLLCAAIALCFKAESRISRHDLDDVRPSEPANLALRLEVWRRLHERE
jgi:hypothetical protein